MDIESALSQLNSMLEDKETNEKLMGIVNLLSSSGLGEGSSDSSPSASSAPHSSSGDSANALAGILSALGGSNEEKKQSKSSDGGLGEISGIFNSISRFFGNSKVSNERRIALLSAIEPFLKEERRAKVQLCIQILRIVGMAKLFENLNL